MAKPLLLTDELARILNTRIILSRAIGLYSLRDLTDEWEISLGTLYRYHSPEYRQSSRLHTQKAWLEEKATRLEGCYKCGGSLQGHARCRGCEILLHDAVHCGSSYC